MTKPPLAVSWFGRSWIDPRVFDIALTSVLLVAGLLTTFLYTPDDGVVYRAPDVGVVVLLVLFTLPLLMRRSRPLAVALVLTGLNLLYLVWNYSTPTTGVVALIVAYTLGAYTSMDRSLLGLVSLFGSTYAYLFITLGRYPQAEPGSTEAITVVALAFVGAWAIGRSIRGPRIYARRLEELAVQLERSHQAEMRAAVAEERGRIARELHDVVAHHVSVMTVQAAGARRTLARDPERSSTALEAIEATGRAALGEMRRIVGVLRGPDEELDSADRGPQPGLADLPDLVAQLGAAGLSVDIRVDGSAKPLPLGIELTAFRVVQEALTNTLKHAGATRADVGLRYRSGELVVDIADNGRGAPNGRDERSRGLGLLGMRERLALYGGELTVGPRADGGFRVLARIPLRDGP